MMPNAVEPTPYLQVVAGAANSQRLAFKAPVFIVGCPRSGTSFLYHLLLSAGGFAEFRTQMNVFDVLEPVFGNLRIAKNKHRMLLEWLDSKAFKVSGLTAEEVIDAASGCHDGSDFLRAIMEAVSRRQGVDRWIDSTPTNLLHILRIAKDFPGARIIHIIRDPRDVALSLDKQGWSRPLPWDRARSLVAAGLYWQWIVRKGRRLGSMLPANYAEVRYEDLVSQPSDTLRNLSTFLDHPLDYDLIQQKRVGSVKTPLTSFTEELTQGLFSPVGRWKSKFPPHQLLLFERAIGKYMRELGYPLATDARETQHFLTTQGLRFEYRIFYDCKQWAKINTSLSRWKVNYSAILIDK